MQCDAAFSIALAKHKRSGALTVSAAWTSHMQLVIHIAASVKEGKICLIYVRRMATLNFSVWLS